MRLARPDEYDAVGALTVRAFVEAGDLDPGGPYADELRRAADRARTGELLVATDENGTLLGTVTVCPAGDDFAIVARPGEVEARMLAVEPGTQRRGVARALMSAVHERAAARGDDGVALCVVAWNAAAHDLYRSLGYTRVPERDLEPHPGVRLEVYVRPTHSRRD